MLFYALNCGVVDEDVEMLNFPCEILPETVRYVDGETFDLSNSKSGVKAWKTALDDLCELSNKLIVATKQLVSCSSTGKEISGMWRKGKLWWAQSTSSRKNKWSLLKSWTMETFFLIGLLLWWDKLWKKSETNANNLLPLYWLLRRWRACDSTLLYSVCKQWHQFLLFGISLCNPSHFNSRSYWSCFIPPCIFALFVVKDSYSLRIRSFQVDFCFRYESYRSSSCPTK